MSTSKKTSTKSKTTTKAKTNTKDKTDNKPLKAKGTYEGVIPTSTLVKTNEQVRKDAIVWAKWIVSDNRFHYGYTSKDGKINAHHNGCYFCGTNKDHGGRSKKGIKDFEFTYCCNTFVGAAWAHGGCIPQALKLCRGGSSWDFNKGTGYDKSPLFDNLGKPARSKLKAGDVLCRNGHVSLYIGGGKIAEAGGGDDNKRNSEKWNNSIRIKTLSDDVYRGYKRVHRYNGSVNTKASIRHGEVSDRVKDLQKFLKWYGYDIKADRIFGDDTLKAVKKFQKSVGMTPDGVVGPNTFKKIKEFKKKAA